MWSTTSPSLRGLLLALAGGASAASVAAARSGFSGTAAEQVTVMSMMNDVFAFNITRPVSTLSVSIALAYGSSAVLLVSRAMDGAQPPTCMGQNSSSYMCMGQTWSVTADAFTAGAALQIPAASPCTPAVIKNMPLTKVDPSCNASTVWGLGQYYVTVFAPTDDPLGIGYTRMITFAESPLVWMEVGQPYLLVTDTVNPLRSPGALAGLSLKNAVAPVQQLRVDLWCGSAMDCGRTMRAYLRTCVADACNSTDMTPSPVTPYDAVFTVGADGDNSGTFTLPQGPCANADPESSCETYLGVYPDCSAPNSCPGPSAVRLSFVRDDSASVLPAACFGSGGGQGSCVARFNGTLQQFATYLGPVGSGDGGGSSMVDGRRRAAALRRTGRFPSASPAAAAPAAFASKVSASRLVIDGHAAPTPASGAAAAAPPPMMSMTMGPAPASGPTAAPFLLSVSACSSAVLVGACYASYPWSTCYDADFAPLAWPRLPLFPKGDDDFGVTDHAPGNTYTLARNGTPSAQLGGWLEVYVSQSDPQLPTAWEVVLAVGASPLLTLPAPLSSAPLVRRSPLGSDDVWMEVTWDAALLGPLDGSAAPVADPFGAFYYVYAFPYPLPAVCAPLASFNLDAACGVSGYLAAVAAGGATFKPCAPLQIKMQAPIRDVNFTADSSALSGAANYTVVVLASCGFTDMCLMMPGGGTQTIAYTPVVSMAGGGSPLSATPYPTPTISASVSPGPPMPPPRDWESDVLLGFGVAAGALLAFGAIGFVGLKIKARLGIRPGGGAAAGAAEGGGGSGGGRGKRGVGRRFGKAGAVAATTGVAVAESSAGRAAVMRQPLLADVDAGSEEGGVPAGEIDTRPVVKQ